MSRLPGHEAPKQHRQATKTTYSTDAPIHGHFRSALRGDLLKLDSRRLWALRLTYVGIDVRHTIVMVG